MTLACRLLPRDEFTRLEQRRIEGRLSMADAFGPGAMWFCPWYHDPSREDDMRDLAAGHHRGFLSPHYLRDHARARPPITVICPNGRPWCIDQMSSNGTGWLVTGEAPTLTVRPSIVVPGYHGWLTDGVFSDDIEGRGPNGTTT